MKVRRPAAIFFPPLVCLLAAAGCAAHRSPGPTGIAAPARVQVAVVPVEPRLAPAASSPPANPALTLPDLPSAGPAPPPAKPKPVLQASIPPELARLAAVKKSPFLTRGELAELLSALPGVPLDRDQGVAIMTDIQGYPARASVLAVVGTGYLDAFANHQFKPEALVTRTELAECLARVVARARGLRFKAAPETVISDLPASNPFHPSVQRVVALGLMSLGDDGRFGPTEPVSGGEGWETLLRLLALLAGRRG